MPNHVANRITFNGDEKQICDMLEKLKMDDVGAGSLDFNKVVPMPENIFRGNLGQKERELYGENNWYDFSISKWGCKWPSYGYEHLEKGYDNNEKSPIFEQYSAKQYLEKFGNSIEFSTAWSAPHPILQKLSEMYPDMEIEHKWADEDFGYNTGEIHYKGGEVTFENVPDGGSKEAYELAADIQGVDLEENFKLSEDGTTYEYVNDEELSLS